MLLQLAIVIFKTRFHIYQKSKTVGLRNPPETRGGGLASVKTMAEELDFLLQEMSLDGKYSSCIS